MSTPVVHPATGVNPRVGRLVIAAACMLFVSCATDATSTPPKSAAPLSGMIYFLPKDIVTVSGDVTYRRSVTVDKKLNVNDDATFSFLSSSVTFAVSTIRDKNHVYTLDIDHKLLQTDDFSVTVKDSGLLSALNSDSTGQTGEVVKNVANFVTSIIPLIGLLGVNEAEYGELRKNFATELSEIDQDARLKARFMDLDNASMLYILNSAAARALWIQIVRLDGILATLKEQRHDMLKIGATATKEELDVAGRRLAYVRESEVEFSAERDTLRQTFDAGLSAFKQQRGIGTKDVTVPYKIALEIGDLPSGGAIAPNMSDANVKAALSKYPKALELWQLARVVATAEQLAPLSMAASSGAAPKSADFMVHYRRATPILVSIYTLASLPVETATTESAITKLVSRDVHYIMHPDSPPVSVSFDRNAFAQRKLALTMNDKGELTKLERKSGSALKEATGSAATAASGALTNLGTAFDATRKIAQTRRDIRLDEIKGDVAKLTEQQNLVNQQIALDGLNASADLLKQKKILDNRLAARQSEISLVNAESVQQLKSLEDELRILTALTNLDSANANLQLLLGQKRLEAELGALRAQLETDKARASFENQTTIDKLKTDIDLARQQIDLIKIQRDLEKERNQNP